MLSALEYERMLSASGPTVGDCAASSDDAHPTRIAFIQCVGSRDQEHQYCSSVCCMFANKQAMLTIDHVPGCVPEVFLMDMRAQGKGFDAFYQRALDHGVRFIRSRPSTIKEDPLTKNLLIAWEDEAGLLPTSAYDLVVLSAGLEPARKAQEGAGALGHRNSTARLLRAQEFEPLATSREGVYVIGPFARAQRYPRLCRPGTGKQPPGHDRAGRLARYPHGGIRSTRRSARSPMSLHTRRACCLPLRDRQHRRGRRRRERVAEYAARLPASPFATDTMYTCSSDSSLAHRGEDRRARTQPGGVWQAARRAPTSLSSRTRSLRPD